MRVLLSVVLVLIGGVTGLALVFTDLLPLPPGNGRIVAGAVFYLALGFLLGRINAAGRPVSWALAAGWGLAILGVVGLWISFTDPASADFALATLFLAGPATAAALGGWIAWKAASR